MVRSVAAKWPINIAPYQQILLKLGIKKHPCVIYYDKKYRTIIKGSVSLVSSVLALLTVQNWTNENKAQTDSICVAILSN